MTSLTIRSLQAGDIPVMVAAFAALGWTTKPASQFELYLAEQEAGQRAVLVAHTDGVFCGYLTICWRAHYRPFREAGIPEIVDFNVLPEYRRRGIGRLLLEAAEQQIAAVSPTAGLGVGMTADYGAAQRLYVRCGYVPDGRGLMYEGHPVNFGKRIHVDDDLCLYLTKQLPGAGDPGRPVSVEQSLPRP